MEGRDQSYMTAYNAVNGVHCIFNATLKNMVRHDWEWDGAVCSDEGDLGSSSGYTGTAAKVAAAIKYGSLSAFDDPLGTGLYMVSGRICGKEYSKLCIVR